MAWLSRSLSRFSSGDEIIGPSQFLLLCRYNLTLGTLTAMRGLYSHLLRYWRWGLLERNLNSMGLLSRIPARGSEQVAWLRKQVGG